MRWGNGSSNPIARSCLIVFSAKAQSRRISGRVRQKIRRVCERSHATARDLPMPLRRYSVFRSPQETPVEAMQRLKLAPAWDANREATPALLRPAPVEGRSHGTQTAPLPAREVDWARRKRPAVKPLPARQSRARVQVVGLLGWHSTPAAHRSLLSALHFAPADRLSHAAEGPAAADIRTPAAPPYPHDQVDRIETRVDRWP